MLEISAWRGISNETAARGEEKERAPRPLPAPAIKCVLLVHMV